MVHDPDHLGLQHRALITSDGAAASGQVELEPAELREKAAAVNAAVALAVGESYQSADALSPLSRCFNSDGEGVSAE